MKKNILLVLSSFFALTISSNSSSIINAKNHTFYRDNCQQLTEKNQAKWAFDDVDASKLINVGYYKKLSYTELFFTNTNLAPWFLTKMIIIKAEDCYTKASWGKRSYYGIPLPIFLKNKDFNEVANNSIADYNWYELLNVKDYDGLAVFIAKIFVGFAWHFNVDLNCYILELDVEFYAETWGSLVGGALWLNIGEGMAITMES